MRGWLVLLAMAVLPACATTLTAADQAGRPSEPSEWATWPGARPAPRLALDHGVDAARVASTLVGLTSLKLVTRRLPDDCTGVVRHAWSSVGVDLFDGFTFAGENGVTAMHRAALDHGTLHLGTPRPGDLIFFRETWDRNRDGAINDGLTHVGIVESVDPEGTVTFVHRGGRGIQRAAMNLNAPAEHRVQGRVLNDYIRPASRQSPARLTSELFVGFSTPAPVGPGVRGQAARTPAR